MLKHDATVATTKSSKQPLCFCSEPKETHLCTVFIAYGVCVLV